MFFEGLIEISSESKVKFLFISTIGRVFFDALFLYLIIDISDSFCEF